MGMMLVNKSGEDVTIYNGTQDPKFTANNDAVYVVTDSNPWYGLTTDVIFDENDGYGCIKHRPAGSFDENTQKPIIDTHPMDYEGSIFSTTKQRIYPFVAQGMLKVIDADGESIGLVMPGCKFWTRSYITGDDHPTFLAMEAWSTLDGEIRYVTDADSKGRTTGFVDTRLLQGKVGFKGGSFDYYAPDPY